MASVALRGGRSGLKPYKSSTPLPNGDVTQRLLFENFTRVRLTSGLEAVCELDGQVLRLLTTYLTSARNSSTIFSGEIAIYRNGSSIYFINILMIASYGSDATNNDPLFHTEVVLC